jgi:ribose transport system substrate-binding protein
MKRNLPAALLLCGLVAFGVNVGSATGVHSAAAPSNYQSLESIIAKYEAMPPFVAPGPAFNAGAAKGKTVFYIPSSSTNPLQLLQDHAFLSVMNKIGVNVTYFTNQGQPTQWAAGVTEAIAKKVNLIVLAGAPDPRVLEPQLKLAQAAHIPVLVDHFYDESAPNPPNVTAMVRAPFNRAAQLMADWIIVDSKGHANVLIITSADNDPAAPMVTAAEAQFSKYCGSACKVSVINVNTSDWTTKDTTATESALVKDPSIQYVVPLFDPEAEFVVAGVVAAGKTNSVKVVSYNGTPFPLKDIESHHVMAMDVGENPVWIGWATADQSLRMLTGTTPVQSEHTVTRIFTASNIAQTGTPPQDGQGYGTAYITGYDGLWGVKAG